MNHFAAFAALPKHNWKALAESWASVTERAFDVRAVAASGDLEMCFFDVIGQDYWTGGGITSKSVKSALDANKSAKNIKVLINSPGGDVAEGMAIYNLLRSHAAEVRTEVVGLAASAASWLMQAGDTRVIHQPAMVMVHGAWTVTQGNAQDHAKTVDLLGKLDNEQCEMFAKRTGLGKDELAAMIADETWMGASEACAMGFADMLAEDDEEDVEAKKKAEASTTVHADVTPQIAALSPEETAKAFADRRKKSPLGSAVVALTPLGQFARSAI